MADNESGAQREQWARTTDAHRTDFEKAKNPLPLRVGAVALWVSSAALEVLAILVAMGKVAAGIPWWVAAIVGVAGCLALTLAAQKLWKKAGAAAGAKGQNVAGVAMACLGFALWAVFFLLAKNLPVKAKVLGVVMAAATVAASQVVAYFI